MTCCLKLVLKLSKIKVLPTRSACGYMFCMPNLFQMNSKCNISWCGLGNRIKDVFWQSWYFINWSNILILNSNFTEIYNTSKKKKYQNISTEFAVKELKVYFKKLKKLFLYQFWMCVVIICQSAIFAFEFGSLLHKIVISLKYVFVCFQMGSIPGRERTRGHY